MDGLIDWISSTRANALIRDTAWIIPVVQSVHILAIAVVMGSVLLLNLRVVGIIGAGEAKDVFTRRYLPWVWNGLVVLLISGIILIVGEPGRDLENSTFWTKMVLVGCAIALTLILEQPVVRRATFWDVPGRRWMSRVLACLAMGCWVGIVLCGRWIAYTY
jgi:uncharacterized membrane protein SirB2